MTLARMIRLHRIPDRPHLLSQGLREMEEQDVPAITDLYARYMKRFGMAIVMTQDEVRHHFLSGRGEGPSIKDSWKNPREDQVVWTYVIEVSFAHIPGRHGVFADLEMRRIRKHTKSQTSSRSTRSHRRS